MPKILITGGSGMLGCELKKFYGDSKILNGKAELDLTDLEKVENFLKGNSFETIIHTAAFTNMNYNEKNPLKALDLHSSIVKLFNRYSEKLIYISAQGKSYNSVYHQTKLKGETETNKKKNNLIIRTNIYGDGGLVKWGLSELKFKKHINGYTNCVFNPVNVSQLSEVIYKNANNLKGIINVGSTSVISKYDFLKLIALKFDLNLELIKPKEVDSYLDLSINLGKRDFNFNLMDGITSLKINL